MHMKPVKPTRPSTKSGWERGGRGGRPDAVDILFAFSLSLFTDVLVRAEKERALNRGMRGRRVEHTSTPAKTRTA